MLIAKRITRAVAEVNGKSRQLIAVKTDVFVRASVGGGRLLARLSPQPPMSGVDSSLSPVSLTTTPDGRHHLPAVPDKNTPEQVDCAGAGLRVHSHNAATVVCISGEIDASNADRVGEAIRRFSQRKAPLILNLSYVDFLGVAGFRALITLNRE